MSTNDVPSRAHEVMLKLLNLIDKCLDENNIPTEWCEAYETLCRAEGARRMNSSMVS